MSKIIFKGISSIVLMIVLSTIVNAYQPVVSGYLAVEQLNDNIDSNATMTIYQSLRNWAWIGYILIPALIFNKELRSLLKTKN